MVRRSDVLLILLLLVLGVAYQLIFLRLGVGLIDEGHLPNAARRIVEGDVLYRDVYTLYPPGSFYVVALLFRIVGPSLIAVRLFHIVMTLILAIVAYFFGKNFMSRGWAFLAALLPAINGWEAFTEHGHYSYLYGAFPFMALYFLAKHHKDPENRKWIVYTGIFSGITLLFRLIPFVGIVGAVTVVSIARNRGFIHTRKELLWFAAGNALVLLPTYLFFFFQSADNHLLTSVFWMSIYQYAGGGGELNLPYPAFELMPGGWSRQHLQHAVIVWEFYIPIIVYTAALLEFGYAHLIKRRAIDAVVAPRLGLTVFGIIIFSRAVGRSDYYHLAPVLAPVFVLGVYYLSRLLSGLRSKGIAATSIAIVVTLLFLHNIDGVLRVSLSTHDRVLLPGSGVFVERRSRLAGLVSHIRATTDSEEPIFVVPWYPILYFVCDRQNPTKYDWLFPGYLRDKDAEQKLINIIDKSSVRVIVYSAEGLDGRQDQSLAAFAGSLDAYIRKNFRFERQFGQFVVLTKQVSNSPKK